MKLLPLLCRDLRLLFGLWFVLSANLSIQAQGIPVDRLAFRGAKPGGVAIQMLLPGEIPGVKADCIEMVGPARHTEPAVPEYEVVWFFVDGRATLQTRDQTYQVEEETIARAPLGWDWNITVSKGETLRAVRIRKELSAADRTEYAKYPQNNARPHVKRFSDCTPYKEAIKSPKTVSRTLLPENIVPRMAAGTVETTGPDQVAPHKHPMLEQFFLGLKGNDCTVMADEAKVSFPQLSLLHIPLGSNHGVQVAEGKRLYYVWMDFFGNNEGQEWLKMHTPVDDGKKSSR